MLQHMTRYSLEKPTISRNEYGEQIVAYTNNGYIDMLIAYNGHNNGVANDVRLTTCNYVGLTNGLVEAGDRVGGRYEVVFTLPGRFTRAFMKEVEDA